MTAQDSTHLKLLEELKPLAGSDATLAFMLRSNLPMNLQTYLEMEYWDGVPKTLSSEQLAMIPEPLRRQSKSL